MKKCVQDEIPAKYEYICDCCGKKIEFNTLYPDGELVTVTSEHIVGNGWTERQEATVHHYCKECFKWAESFMKVQSEKTLKGEIEK